MGLREVVIHAWSWLNYKPVYSDGDNPGMPNRRAFPEANAMWVPEDDQKRLAAYKLLQAYDNNQAAELAEAGGDPGARDRREFGDPAMFLDTVMSHVLGREQTITVAGADTDSEQPTPEEAMAARVQDLLRTWAEDELLAMRVQQTERKAVTLGDGVYRLAWEPGKNRPVLRVHDPGFYFPILPEDGDAGDYPTRVHFAWDLPADPRRGVKARLRRITYELDWIRPATASGVDQAGRAVRAPLPAVGPDPDSPDTEVPPPLTAGDLYYPETGAIARQYPWNDTPSYVTCYLTDATWILEDIKGNPDVDALPLAAATFATRGDGEVLDHLDLMLDFVPVIHLPNTVPPAEEHWGQSSLAKVLQIFDELTSADTDSAKASATTGAPVVGVWGKAADSRLEVHTIQAGMFLKLGEGGGMETLDTSRNLAELRSHVHDLEERAAKVARLPAVALGTLDPSQAPSGYAMDVSLGPLDALIASMRLARDHKYTLLLKMVQRLFMAGQHPDWTGLRVMPARLAFGSYKPTDKAAVLELAAAGLKGGVLSLETAVQMLREAGFPIEDAQREIERIQARQFEQARALADATGDMTLVGDFLGVTVTEPDPDDAPPPNLPDDDADGSDDGQDDEEDGDETDPQGNGGNT
ncbi:hypothetical protein KVH31_34670 [Streptomyces olivaceus]|uniref:hypothetical protein n=1 Tax=Streptomyces olivaceus TaxID=47716 RepID=UPI001CCC0F56|nr:hypothetical protein [Streptomyces olivaceus]MBZ6211642.1 hypothetical protein [Streptomyces olivaceus]